MSSGENLWRKVNRFDSQFLFFDSENMKQLERLRLKEEMKNLVIQTKNKEKSIMKN